MMAMEAVMIAAVLMVGVAMLSGLQPRQNSFANAGAAEVVHGHLEDLLSVMRTMEDPEYGTKLKRFIVECSNDNPTNLSAFMRSALPVGVEYRLSIWYAPL